MHRTENDIKRGWRRIIRQAINGMSLEDMLSYNENLSKENYKMSTAIIKDTHIFFKSYLKNNDREEEV